MARIYYGLLSAHAKLREKVIASAGSSGAVAARLWAAVAMEVTVGMTCGCISKELKEQARGMYLWIDGCIRGKMNVTRQKIASK